MVAERCCDYGTSAVVELIRRVFGTHGYGATVLAPSVGKSVKNDTTLTSELTMITAWKISLRD